MSRSLVGLQCNSYCFRHLFLMYGCAVTKPARYIFKVCILSWPSSWTVVQSILFFIYNSSFIHNVRVVFLWMGREQRNWESQRDYSWEFRFLNRSITVPTPHPIKNPSRSFKKTNLVWLGDQLRPANKFCFFQQGWKHTSNEQHSHYIPDWKHSEVSLPSLTGPQTRL